MEFDDLFNALTIVALFMFTLELVICSIAKENYFCSFFFYLDFIATISLILDVTWVSEALFSPDATQSENTDDKEEAGELRKASRASRVATKAGRVVRVIRLIRIVKLYKAAVEARQRREDKKKFLKEKMYLKKVHPAQYEEDDFGDFDDEMDFDKKRDEEELSKESQVGKKLTERTTRTVIIVVLAMLFVVPLFDSKDGLLSAHEPVELSSQYGADLLTQSFKEMRKHNILETDTTVYRRMYELSLLQVIYRHFNPWMKDDSEAQKDTYNFLHSLFFIGHSHTTEHADDLKLKYYNDPDEWDRWFEGDGFDGPFQSNFTSMKLSTETKNGLFNAWEDKCKSHTGIYIDRSYECYELRYTEYEVVTPNFVDDSDTHSDDDKNKPEFVFYFDIRRQTSIDATLNMFQTLFICVMLVAGAMFISWDTNRLVLFPIEQMIAKMNKIRDNPLHAMKMGDEELQKQDMMARKTPARRTVLSGENIFNPVMMAQEGKENSIRVALMACRKKYLKLKKAWVAFRSRRTEVVEEPMETLILEKTIIKLGSLLALGFGEAGAEIIGSNMGGSKAGVNAMIPGKKVEAIFGFCYIRNFTDATEILQDDVMVFVNQIGEIVHSIVDSYHGAPNKNIGDAFLCAWRVRALNEEVNQSRRTRMCDMSVLSFVKIIAAINRSKMLAEYRGHPGLLSRLPRYRVRMGFGLHFGGAIEGAIGSEFKIDASYLSPNVNIASRLEAATKQFGVSMLMSNILVEHCSENIRKQMRQLDCVRVKGSQIPITLSTIDLNFIILRMEKLPVAKCKLTRRRKYDVRQARDVRKLKKWGEDYDASEDFLNDDDIKKMREIYTQEFYLRFNMGYLNYIAGQWEVARDVLEHTLYMIKTKNGMWVKDMPSQTLLLHLEKHDYIAPDSWNGVRTLTEK